MYADIHELFAQGFSPRSIAAELSVEISVVLSVLSDSFSVATTQQEALCDKNI